MLNLSRLRFSQGILKRAKLPVCQTVNNDVLPEFGDISQVPTKSPGKSQASCSNRSSHGLDPISPPRNRSCWYQEIRQAHQPTNYWHETNHSDCWQKPYILKKKKKRIWNFTPPKKKYIFSSLDFGAKRKTKNSKTGQATKANEFLGDGWTTHLKNMQPSNWIISPNIRGENKQYLKPPTR